MDWFSGLIWVFSMTPIYSDVYDGLRLRARWIFKSGSRAIFW
ncbi:hypothetical protein COO91_03726 [Nostoc flagelliforme CCNUN1]|uniref:Uncharacterized protein n=1 Tax=Nostoc flagelliforme CCNUN1 TaxID=2038116 RepID=A0A2K8SQR8_9NOSO|nr:hypothetical protein COO91_03726 [Nostoc flagelliforme CCNUN1]